MAVIPVLTKNSKQPSTATVASRPGVVAVMTKAPVKTTTTTKTTAKTSVKSPAPSFNAPKVVAPIKKPIVSKQVNGLKLSLVEPSKPAASAKLNNKPSKVDVNNPINKVVQATAKVGGDIANQFPQAKQQAKDIFADPLALKTSPKKFVDDIINSFKQPLVEEIKRINASNKANYNSKSTLSQRISADISAKVGAVNVALSPITALFNAGNDIPIVGSFTKALGVAFTALGEGATAVSNKLVDTLPISKQQKAELKPALGEMFALAAQIAIGGKHAEEALKGAKERIVKVYGKKEGNTIITQATEMAKNKPKTEYTPQEVINSVINGEIQDTPQGKTLMKTALEAQKKELNVQLGEPVVEAGLYDTGKTYATLHKVSPEADITVYRGVKGSQNGKLSPNDWVTQDKELARMYARDRALHPRPGEARESARIISQKVKAKDLMVDQSTNPGVTNEFRYQPQSHLPTTVSTKGGLYNTGKAFEIEQDIHKVNVKTQQDFLDGKITQTERNKIITENNARSVVQQPISDSIIKYKELFPNKKMLNADDVREIYKDQGYNRKNSADFQDESSIVTNHLFDEQVAKLKPGDEYLFTAGASGVGKSRGIKALNLENSAGLDGNFSSERSIEKIGKVIDKTGKARILFTYKEPFDAWVDGVVHRAIDPKNGRVVPLDVFLHNLVESPKRVLEAKQKFGDKVKLEAYNNTGVGRFEANPVDFISKITYNIGDVKRQILKWTNQQIKDGKIDPETGRFLLGKTEETISKGNESQRPSRPSVEPQGISKIGKSIEAKAIEAKLTKGFENTAGYDKITLKDQAEKASNLINKDFETARAIIRGEEELPGNLKGTALITAMEEHIKQNPSSDLAYELANSPLVSATSKAGQELRLAAEREPDSATAKLSEIKQAREAKIKELSRKQDVVKEQLKTEIKKINLPKEELNWNRFLDSIQC